MIDKKKMEQIHDKAEEAMRIFNILESMEKKNMKWYVDDVLSSVDRLNDICKEMKKLIDEY